MCFASFKELFYMIYNVEQCKILAKNLQVKQAFLFSCLHLSKDISNYKIIKIPKKNGNFRTIVEPPKEIKIIQRKIVDYLRKFQNEKYCAYGFVKAKNNVKNAQLHINKQYVFKTDLKDFFISIKAGRIHNMFLAKPFEFCKVDATILTNLLCFQNSLAQGFPSSPYISNIIARRLDNAMLKLSKKYKCNYSRYADDLIFSSNMDVFSNQFNCELREIITNEMFIINENKTKLINSKSRQIVTGIIVNKKTNLKREYYRELRQILYTWKKYGIDKCCEVNNKNEEKLNKYVLGRLAYYKAVVGADNDCYLRLCDAYNFATNSEHFKVPIKYKLNNARYILKSGNIKPAGNSASDVLEEFLKILCRRNGITKDINNKNIENSTIDPLKDILKSKSVITIIQAKEIETLNTIRNMCNHNKTQTPTHQDVEILIAGIDKLIKELN